MLQEFTGAGKTALPFQEITFSNGSTYDSATGVCVALGYSSAIQGSDKFDASATTSALKMNADGSIAQELTDYPVSSIACFEGK